MIIRIVTIFGLALLTTTAAAPAQEQPRMGGVLKAGMIGEAPTLDLHVTTAVITQQITWHMYETLYTYDKDLSPIPMLAEGHAIADNGRRYTITLRKGVRFHNGKEMTSADVVPSLQHWGKPELFDIFSTGFTLNPDPAIATAIQCNWPGWWCLEEKEKLMADMARETDPKKRRAIIEKVQALFYEDVGRIKFGDYFTLDVTRKEVRGFKTGPYTYFWNSWIAK